MNWYTQNGFTPPIHDEATLADLAGQALDADQEENEPAPLRLFNPGLNIIRDHVRGVLFGKAWITARDARRECHAVALVADDPEIRAEFTEYGDAMWEIEEAE